MTGGWVQVVTVVFGVLGAAGGAGGLLLVRVNRRRITAEARQIRAQADESVASTVKVLIGGAADLVEPLKRELREARTELDGLRRSVENLTYQVQLASRVYEAIWDPDVTVERLRAMVPTPRDWNGR